MLAGKLSLNQCIMFGKHNSTDSFTVHKKAYNHYIKSVRETCSNSNNIVFREEDSPLISTLLILKPSKAYSFQDC